MAIVTRFTELVGCSVPVQQAPMGSLSGPDLVAAAVDAGALGMVGLSGYPVEAIVESLDRLREATPGPFGGNFLLPFIEDPAVITACAERARVVDFWHGSPDSHLVGRAHAAGALVCWQVGSVEDARAAADCGADLLAARGVEGGGRMHGVRTLWSLLCEVLDAVGDVTPVLAAGGIGTGRGLAAALAAGADGVRIGTVLAATEESAAHPRYKEALLTAEAADSVLTDEFSVGWPGGPHPARVLGRSIDAAMASNEDVVAHVPMGGSLEPIPRFSPHPPSADVEGQIDAMPMYAGESVSFVRSIEPVRQVISRIVDDAERLLAAAPQAGKATPHDG